MKPWLTFVATSLFFLIVIAVSIAPLTVHADDELITACDGGSASCVLDTNPGASTARLNWTMTVRCETDPARYSMSIDAGACSVASKSLKLDADRTFDLDVNKSQGSRTAPKRYVCFALDDGGIPQCAIYKQPN